MPSQLFESQVIFNFSNPPGNICSVVLHISHAYVRVCVCVCIVAYVFQALRCGCVCCRKSLLATSRLAATQMRPNIGKRFTLSSLHMATWCISNKRFSKTEKKSSRILFLTRNSNYLRTCLKPTIVFIKDVFESPGTLF